jgi:hypothetical protein
MIISLEDDLADEVYNVPLTLKIKTSWGSARVTGSAKDGDYRAKDGLLLIDANPDSKITIEKLELID